MERTFYLLVKSEDSVSIDYLFTEEDIIFYYGKSKFKNPEEKETFKIKKGTYSACLSGFKNNKGYYSRCITLCHNNIENFQKIVFENVYLSPTGSVLLGSTKSVFTGNVLDGFDSFVNFYKICPESFNLVVSGIDDFVFLPF